MKSALDVNEILEGQAWEQRLPGDAPVCAQDDENSRKVRVCPRASLTTLPSNAAKDSRKHTPPASTSKKQVSIFQVSCSRAVDSSPKTRILYFSLDRLDDISRSVDFLQRVCRQITNTWTESNTFRPHSKPLADRQPKPLAEQHGQKVSIRRNLC
jgi:hypothetical protein